MNIAHSIVFLCTRLEDIFYIIPCIRRPSHINLHEGINTVHNCMEKMSNIMYYAKHDTTM